MVDMRIIIGGIVVIAVIITLSIILSKKKVSKSSPETSSSDAPSGPPVSFDGHYGNFDDGFSLTQRGDEQCKDYAIDYNTKNPTTPYVGYGLRDDKHTGGYEKSCIFYKADQLKKASKSDNSKSLIKVISKCLDSTKYPNNFCLDTPPPKDEEPSITPYDGYYSVFDDGAPGGFTGEDKCKQNIETMNARSDFPDKYVGYGLRDNNQGAYSNSCVFYRKSQIANASRVDTSKDDKKVTTKCTNGISPNNWCS
jgi:hypothetical protein